MLFGAESEKDQISNGSTKDGEREEREGKRPCNSPLNLCGPLFLLSPDPHQLQIPIILIVLIATLIRAQARVESEEIATTHAIVLAHGELRRLGCLDRIRLGVLLVLTRLLPQGEGFLGQGSKLRLIKLVALLVGRSDVCINADVA